MKNTKPISIFEILTELKTQKVDDNKNRTNKGPQKKRGR